MSTPGKTKFTAPRSYPQTSSRQQVAPAPAGRPMPQDARLLLKAGLWFLVAGIASMVLIETVFGGIHHHGPHTNGGWLLLIVAMTCVPLGIMVSVLGGAKWLGSRRR